MSFKLAFYSFPLFQGEKRAIVSFPGEFLSHYCVLLCFVCVLKSFVVFCCVCFLVLCNVLFRYFVLLCCVLLCFAMCFCCCVSFG